jgi:hypothetical protein
LPRCPLSGEIPGHRWGSFHAEEVRRSAVLHGLSRRQRVKRSNLLSIYRRIYFYLTFSAKSSPLARYRSAALPLASVVLSASIERQLRMA